MTTVEITTTEAEARRLTTRIKLVFGSMLDQHDKLVELVEEAKATSAHVALGYPSWPACVSTEFGELQARLGIDDRPVLVGALTATGLPTRTIAEVAGVDHSTVVRDQKQVVLPAPPAERKIAGPGRRTRRYSPSGSRRDAHRCRIPTGAPCGSCGSRPSAWRGCNADDRFLANRNTLHDLHRHQLSNVQALVDALDMDLDGHYQCSDCDERMLPDDKDEIRCKTCREVER